MVTRLLPVAAAILLMTACAPFPPAPVVDRTQPIPTAGERASAKGSTSAPDASVGTYVVRDEDTLYSIAFRNELDWKALARWNGIVAPYIISPGQELRLQPPSPEEAAAMTVTYGTGTGSNPVPAVTPEPLPPAGERGTVGFEPVASTPAQPGSASTPPTTPPPVAVEEPAAPTAPSVADQSRDSQPPVSSAPVRASRRVSGIVWQWPADGKVLGGYVANDPTRQGIDIGGQRGAPVRAAADGMVVYSGNGLIGYGELIIVKHSDVYLSAYGHNQKRLVKEGDRVKAGQKIATMGSSGTDRVELHFEVRKQGQPIDPSGFLPTK